MATHSSILACRIPWTEEPGRLQSVRLHRVGHDWGHTRTQSEDQRSKPKPAKGVKQNRLATRQMGPEALGIRRQESDSGTLGLGTDSSRGGEVLQGLPPLGGMAPDQGQSGVKAPPQHLR